MANALTTLRLLLVAPFAYFMAKANERSAAIALIIWLVALATDFLDGPIARRRRTVSAASRLFDHATDFLFVASGMFAGAARGAFPWVLPACVTAAFAQYVIDSYWIHRHAGLRGSWLGRYNGILYFIPPAMDAVIRLGTAFLRPVLTLLVWLLVASTIVSIGQRLMYRPSPEQLSGSSTEK